MARSKSVCAVVPAAGLATRFGGPNKLLQPWRGGTVVGTVVRILRECGLPTVVATGRDAERVTAAVSGETIFNPAFADGLGTSIACGVLACPNADGYLIALGDMPSLRPDVVQRLLEEFEKAGPEAILAPVYSFEKQRPGHPVLFGSNYREALISLEGDEGARSILLANQHHLRLVRFEGSLDDIDLPDDL